MYERELEVALAAAREAGAAVRHFYDTGTEAWEKSEDNPLTHADLESDRIIALHIRAAFPDDAILSEETVDDLSRVEKSRVWIVDPMDGTKEFTKKIPEFCVSIGLVVDGEPVVGVALNPAAEVAVWASKGNGTFKDGERVHVTDCAKLEDAVVIASRTEISRDKFAAHEGWFKELQPLGSIAWKLACVAAGEGDLNVSMAPKNEWDVCAGDCLVREAGGVYVDFDGAPRIYNQKNPLIETFMAAGPKALVDEFSRREAERTSA
ncbi:MAG: 3'(2'),5'-bisphosphate nucleotidase CysQ [Deltaproteobacteria bacterium]|nr:3'(2'),5'-bisphosphate nucleotidase CysQ [Deltaproteobacteria bacterium]MBW2446380.1 3'(2'),5'-bisphosphate nucleotidase CysQ [Deltaproteobacteria bacterium]